MKDNERKKREEIANVVTHGIGICLAVAGLVVMIIQTKSEFLWGFVIYGLSLVLLYIVSTTYHSARHLRKKLLLKKLDHIAIFLLIAGTYTPFCLSILQDGLRWALLSIVWGVALAGIVFKVFHTGRHEVISLILYVVNGWLVIAVIKPVYETMSTTGFTFLMLGGFFYSAGIIFYVSRRMRYHAIWHLFVLAGSCFHFFSVLTLGR